MSTSFSDAAEMSASSTCQIKEVPSPKSERREYERSDGDSSKEREGTEPEKGHRSSESV